MPLKSTCPVCAVTFNYPEQHAGKTSRCPKCGKPVLLAPSDTKTPIPPLPASENTDVSDSKSAKTNGRVLPPLPARRQNIAISEGSHNNREEQPRAGQRDPKKYWLLAGSGFSLILVLVISAIVAIAMASKQNPTQEPLAKGEDQSVPRVDETPASEPSTDSPTQNLSPTQIYKKLIRSTVLIVSGDSIGSGVLVDQKESLVVTNHHVVAGNRKVTVFFPVSEDGVLVNSPRHYLERVKTLGIPSEVVFSDPKRDLALVRLSELPSGVAPVRLARRSPEPGTTLVSIGAPGVEGIDRGLLWRMTMGRVRNVGKQVVHYRGQTVDCKCVEADSATNQGDSGGPGVDERCRLIAIVSGGRTDKRLVSFFIDISEVRAVLESHLKRPLDEGDEPSVPSEENPVSKLRLAIASGGEMQQLQAVRQLADLNAEAQLAVPDLIKIWENASPELAIAIDAALDRIGKPALTDIGSLKTALGSNRKAAKLYAIRWLQQLKGKAEFLLPELLTACRNSDADVCIPALNNLPHVATWEKEGVARTLIESLKSDHRNVKLETLAAIGRMSGVDRTKLLEPLLITLADSDEKVCDVAEKLLSDLGQPSERDVAIFCQGLSQKSLRVRIFSLRSLTRIGKQSVVAVPQVSQLVGDPDPNIRHQSLVLLNAIGSESASAQKSVIVAVRDPEPKIRSAALSVLKVIGGRPGIYPIILEALVDTDASVRASAKSAIEELKQPHRNDIPELIKYINSSNPTLQIATLASFKTLGQQAKPALVHVSRVATTDKHLRVRVAALDLMETFGSDGREFSPAILKTLTEKNALPLDEDKSETPLLSEDFRAAVLRTLVKIGVDDSEGTTKQLVVMLGGRDKASKVLALKLLAPQGQKLRPHWRLLFEVAEDVGGEGKELAIRLLGGICDNIIAGSIYDIILRSTNENQMNIGVDIIATCSDVDAAIRYLNRIKFNTDRRIRYPASVRKAASDAAMTLEAKQKEKKTGE